MNNSDQMPASEIWVVEEAHFRSFDLLLAEAISKAIYDYTHFKKLLVHMQLLQPVARTEKRRMRPFGLLSCRSQVRRRHAGPTPTKPDS